MCIFWVIVNFDSVLLWTAIFELESKLFVEFTTATDVTTDGATTSTSKSASVASNDYHCNDKLRLLHFDLPLQESGTVHFYLKYGGDLILISSHDRGPEFESWQGTANKIYTILFVYKPQIKSPP